MVIADQRTSDDFVLFPFTHPENRSHGSNKKVSRRSLGSVNNNNTQLHKQPMVKATSQMSKLAAGFDLTAPRILKGQQYKYEDYENNDQTGTNVDHERDDDDAAEWNQEEIAEFLAAEQECLNSIEYDDDDDDDDSLAKLGRESMLVQVGQPEMYGSEMEKYERNKELETMHEARDDAVYETTPALRKEEYKQQPVPAAFQQKELPSPEVEASAKGRILMMVTNLGMNRTQVQNQQRATMLMNALSIPYDTLDGSDPKNKDVRNALFVLSDMRGIYPQFFVVSEGDDGEVQTTFLGDWETIEGINDSSSLPGEILEANPTLLTWDRIPGLVFKK
jgi:hypothetical protein